MATVNVTVTGVQRDATLTWNGALRPLTNTGGGTWSTAFVEAPGQATYVIDILSNPGDPWTASVADGTTTFNHSGHASPAGTDTTGLTPFTVT